MLLRKRKGMLLCTGKTKILKKAFCILVWVHPFFSMGAAMFFCTYQVICDISKRDLWKCPRCSNCIILEVDTVTLWTQDDFAPQIKIICYSKIVYLFLGTIFKNTFLFRNIRHIPQSKRLQFFVTNLYQIRSKK